MILLVNTFIVRHGFMGITLWPFVIIRHENLKKDITFLNHERIHIRQQGEMLVLLFFIWYSIEFLFRLIQYRDFHDAYRNISFEREAYACEKNLDYLEHRSFWNFIAYV